MYWITHIGIVLVFWRADYIDTKFFSQVEQHDEDLYLAIKNINHIKTKAVTLKYM